MYGVKTIIYIGFGTTCDFTGGPRRYSLKTRGDSYILNSQKVEASQVSIARGMDKQNVLYTYMMEC